MDIIFQYERSPSGGIDNPQLTLYGATDRFSLYNIKPSTEFAGVRFHPGMAAQFLKVNPIELFQQEVRVQDGAEFGQVFDQLCACGSNEQALRTLQRNLLKLQLDCRSGISSPIREALRLISSTDGRMSVSQIANVIGISERTLRRGVTTTVGLSPKVLARILRFQHVTSCLRAPEPLICAALQWSVATLTRRICGREFQQLSGLTPTAFIS